MRVSICPISNYFVSEENGWLWESYDPKKLNDSKRYMNTLDFIITMTDHLVSESKRQIDNGLRFQYFSDIHLEFFKSHEISSLLQQIQPMAPYLILAGDIGSVLAEHRAKYEQFLEFVSQRYKMVFLIAGNHEYYSLSTHSCSKRGDWFEYIEGTIREMVRATPNVIFLQNEFYAIPETNLCVYGTTLWSQIDDDLRFIIKHEVNDYHFIPHFTTQRSCELFHSNVEHLKQTLEQNPDKQFLVISHHLPSYELIAPKYRTCELNSSFASSVECSHNPQIVAWMCGHTHIPCEKDHFHVNPIGYPQENREFNCNKVIQL